MNAKLKLAGSALTVGAATLRDRVSPPTPRTASDIPANGVSLNREWLTAVLCADVPGAEVTSWTSPGGSSGTSERAALRVEYNAAGQAAGLPTILYTKSTSSFSQRLLLGGADVLHGETHFYMDYRPDLKMEAPSGYWGGADRRTGRSLVIMDDIAVSKGARFIDATEPLTRAQVEDVLANMAVYHGAWWDSPALAKLKTANDHFHNVADMIDMGGRCAVGMTRSEDVHPPELLGQAARLWEGTEKSLQLLTDATPTLLHGDSHVGQMYVTDDGRMGITDWQATLRGSWTYDFAYFVSSACEPEDRRAWEDDLLKDYLEKLEAAGGQAPTFEEAKLAYRRSLFYPYSAWAFTIGRAWYQPQMQTVPVCRAILHRMSHAIHENDSFEALGI
ncbi:hypothetical protein ASD11_00625 [Aeromicrobium sp. Root495]|uniref:phosphotransferase n=1 Tax=Aeromicrobium sp. Root495 TaxID=1736550 RepID=UPI0006FFAE8D|nr:phosphotransferase [Aeromicrobium sp. Root495]KQY58209.1 hypothetical protein ASD11_00625 [Aeromicrobium sp. Root495]